MSEDIRKMIDKVKNFKQFVNENTVKTIQLIHITTPEIANDIKLNGFQPKQFIDYKYYSDLGKEGIYFYDNRRQAQFYAGFLIGKTKIDKVAMIFVDAPLNVVIKSEKLEDGYFIKSENLDNIKINDIKLVKYSEIY
jgi:hypothetical protein